MADVERPHVYSPAKLAERWGCSVGHIHKLVDSGQVTAFRIGRLVRILTDNVEKYEEERRRKAETSMSEPAVSKTENAAKPSRKKAAPRLPLRR